MQFGECSHQWFGRMLRKVLTHFATNDESNALSNTLLGQALIDGHVATQVLAIRRLMDAGNSEIISLRRLVKEIRRNFALFTREKLAPARTCPLQLR